MSESSGLKNKFVYSFFGTSYGSTILFPDLLTFNCQIKSLFKPCGRGGGILGPQYFWYFGAPEEHAAADHNARYETKMDWPTQKVLRIILPITTFPFHIGRYFHFRNFPLLLWVLWVFVQLFSTMTSLGRRDMCDIFLKECVKKESQSFNLPF